MDSCESFGNEIKTSLDARETQDGEEEEEKRAEGIDSLHDVTTQKREMNFILW